MCAGRNDRRDRSIKIWVGRWQEAFDLIGHFVCAVSFQNFGQNGEGRCRLRVYLHRPCTKYLGYLPQLVLNLIRLCLGNVQYVETEAQGALIALGYKPAEVAKMLKPLDVATMTTEALIREALRQVHAGR